MKKTISSFLFLALFAANIPLAGAIPARRGGEHNTQIESCEPSVKRFPYGPGRRSSSTAVLVTLRQQVFNVNSSLDAASSAQTVAALDNQHTDFGTGAITASGYSGDGSGLSNLTVTQNATIDDSFTNVTSYAVTHNFNSRNVIVQVYDTDH